jgi:nitrogen fixation NifU-like protein
MNDPLENLIQQLQDQMLKEIKEIYGEKVYERWINPLYMGPLDDPHGYARLRGRCEDTMEIFLKFENNRVKEASFQSDGCGSSIVCGSFAVELSFGKSPDELLDITGDTILEKFGRLPKEDEHCAFLAAETLHGAIDDYMIKQINKKGSGGLR